MEEKKKHSEIIVKRAHSPKKKIPNHSKKKKNTLKFQEVEFMWKRGRTLGKGSFGFVSLASTDSASPIIPSIIAVV